MPPRRSPSTKDRLRTFLLANVGRVVSSAQLREVGAPSTEWARRVRELRDHEGYDIQTHTDRDDLKPGEYILVSATPRPTFSESISKETRAFVLDRNGFTCQMCGAAAGERHPDDGRTVRLHIGHIVDRSKDGPADASNLRALCRLCNEGARNLTLDPPRYATLLAQVRRAKRDDQLKVFEWLQNRFQPPSGESR